MTTRKDELRARARKIIDNIYGPRADACMGATYDEYVGAATDALIAVEREVWEKTAKHFSSLHKRELDLPPNQRIADGSAFCFLIAAEWCEGQAKESHDQET